MKLPRDVAIEWSSYCRMIGTKWTCLAHTDLQWHLNIFPQITVWFSHFCHNHSLKITSHQARESVKLDILVYCCLNEYATYVCWTESRLLGAPSRVVCYVCLSITPSVPSSFAFCYFVAYWEKERQIYYTPLHCLNSWCTESQVNSTCRTQ